MEYLIKHKRMTIVLVVIALILVYAGVSYINFQKLVKAGQETAAKAVPFEQIKPGATMRILVAGDSTVVGTGVVDPKTSTAGRFGTDYPEAEVINLGKNGRRVGEMLTEFKAKKDTLGKLDIIVFQIGGNDITHFTNLKEVERDVTELLTEARKVTSKVIILHTGDLGSSPIFPFPIGFIISHQTRMVRDIYLKATAATDTHYVDLYALKTDKEFHVDNDRFYGNDYFHLSGDGYGVWYREIQKVLQTIK